MLVQASLSRLEKLKLGVIGIQLALHRGEVQRFEEKRNISAVGSLRETLALTTPHDPDYVALLVVRKEVFQAHTEHQGDA
jgi:hypothetical protein